MTMLNTNTTYPIKAKSKNVIRIFLGLPPSEQCSDLGGGTEHLYSDSDKRGTLIDPSQTKHCSEGEQTHSTEHLYSTQTPFTCQADALLNICAVSKHRSPAKLTPFTMQ